MSVWKTSHLPFTLNVNDYMLEVHMTYVCTDDYSSNSQIINPLTTK